MGQSTSSPRERDGSSSRFRVSPRRRSRRTSELLPTLHHPSESPSLASAMGVPTLPRPHSRMPSTRLLATFTRQISASSVGAGRGVSPQAEGSGRRDAIFYEQQEERPLVHMEELGMRNAPITNITASPMPRRSRLSRLGSMIMSRDVNSEGNQDLAEQEVSWQRPLTRDSLEIVREVQRQQNRLSHHFDAGSHEPQEEIRQRGRGQVTPISRPIPLRADSPMPASILTLSQDMSSRGSLILDPTDTPQTNVSTTQRLSRLARIRQSISPSFDLPSFVHRSPSQDLVTATPQQLPTRNLSPIRGLIPETSASTTSAGEIDRIMPNSDDGPDQPVEGLGAQDPSDFLDIDVSGGRGSSWTNRWADRSHVGRRQNRRVSNLLSGRSTRSTRRDPDGPVPRILNLAALALAARLAGSNPRSNHDPQSMGSDAIDGSLQTLLQALQTTVHLSPGDVATAEHRDGSGRSTGLADPLSYLRVFRFVSIAAGSTSDAESSSQGQSHSPTRSNNQPAARDSNIGSQESEGRTVTLVVIGVRSIPSEDSLREASPTLDPVPDSLLEIPPLVSPANVPSPEIEIEISSRPAEDMQNVFHARRASSGDIAPFSGDYDRQRLQRTSSTHDSNSADASLIQESVISPSPPTSDSPPGPRPPPSTPAEPSLSALSSQVPTPSRRPSSASIIQQAQISTREAAIPHLRESADPITAQQGQPTLRVQHRRRSESESARHRDLGAGAARRNGVVAPDEADNPAPAIARSRSWLIYVVGTNIAEDHPALTAPSLFTDNPSYEDMLFLSSLLGPAKPPVASPEDISSAGGLYRISDNHSLAVEVMQGTSSFQISPDERCLVCLEEYQMHEELRQLNECSHVFHQACIDEWLTTGRNSCPLCRGQGVPEEKRNR